MKGFYIPSFDEGLFASIGRAFLLMSILIVPIVSYILWSDLIRIPPIEIAGEGVVVDTPSTQNQDLAAQQGMWGSAVALVLLTLGQIVVGLLTLGLVYNTFRVQKGELEATNEANRLQLRPYLSLESFDINVIGHHTNCSAYLTITIKNTGATIARVYNCLSTFDSNIVVRDQVGQVSVNHIGYNLEDRVAGESAYTPVNPQQDFIFHHQVSLSPMHAGRAPSGSALDSNIRKDSIESYLIRGVFHFKDSFGNNERPIHLDFVKTVMLGAAREGESLYRVNDKVFEVESDAQNDKSI